MTWIHYISLSIAFLSMLISFLMYRASVSKPTRSTESASMDGRILVLEERCQTIKERLHDLDAKLDRIIEGLE